MFVGCPDRLVVPKRPPGLNNRRNPRSGCLIDPIPKWKESIGCHYSTLGRWLSLLDTYLYRIHPAHLSRSDTHGSPLFGEHDGIGLDVFDDSPGKIEVP